MAYPKIPAAERFLRKVDRRRDSECWPWLGGLDRDGYGYFTVSKEPRKTAKAHRFAWELAIGPIPEGLSVLHACDNPPCCNPSHLFLGDQAANNRDMWGKGRGRKRVWKRKPCVRKGRRSYAGLGNPNAHINPGIAQAVRRRYADGESQMSIARSIGISQAQVSKIVRGLVWVEE